MPVGDYSELNELRGDIVEPEVQTGTRRNVRVDASDVLVDPTEAELIAANPGLGGGSGNVQVDENDNVVKTAGETGGLVDSSGQEVFTVQVESVTAHQSCPARVRARAE